MKIKSIVSANRASSNWNMEAWDVVFRVEDGRCFRLDQVMQIGRPEVNHIQLQADTNPDWFWNYGAKPIVC